ncbi:MAG TPA: META domain-containing protein [Acidimicrobiia bacterium]|nr:META domain-containing protein [Acidimicrobiia bacterium]
MKYRGWRRVSALTLVSLSACAGDASTTVPEVTSTVPAVTSTTSVEVGSVVGTWGLDSITVDGRPMALSPDWATFDHPDVVTWITFNEAGLVNGRLTCNGFMGQYEQVGSTIDWEVVKEAAACVDEERPGVMEAEEPMTDLIWTPSVDVAIDEEEGFLVLAGSDVVMTFSRLAD